MVATLWPIDDAPSCLFVVAFTAYCAKSVGTCPRRWWRRSCGFAKLNPGCRRVCTFSTGWFDRRRGRCGATAGTDRDGLGGISEPGDVGRVRGNRWATGWLRSQSPRRPPGSRLTPWMAEHRKEFGHHRRARSCVGDRALSG